MGNKVKEHLELILYDFEYADHYLTYSMKHIEYLQKSPDLSEEEKKSLKRVYINISNILKNLNKLRHDKEISDLLENYEKEKS